MALFQPGMIGPNINSQVDPENETVQGRIGSLLQTDERGGYINPVVRQAVNRQDQAFNERGVLNSSMAVQGGTEAAISKALEIAAPDAKTYYDNRRTNVDAQNKFASQDIAGQIDLSKQKDTQQFELAKQKDTQSFTTRQDYQKAVQAVGLKYQDQISTINASNMTPEDKSVAIAQVQAMRDGELTYQNNIYSRMPSWSNDWLTAAVPTAGMNIGTVTNRDTLSNIANDPAQTQANRDAATGGMIGGVTAGGTTAPVAGTAALPATTSTGQAMDWSITDRNGQTAQQAWTAYQANPTMGTLTAEQFYAWFVQSVAAGNQEAGVGGA